MTTASDNFDRANETPLASPWATGASVGVNLTSNQIQGSGATDCTSLYNSGTWGNDQEAQITVVGGLASGSHYIGCGVRLSATGNGYSFITDGVTGSTHSIIERFDAGVTTEILALTMTATAGDVLKLRMVGTTLTAYKNGVAVGSVTSATYASGFPGVCSFGANPTGDTWSATDDIHAPQHDYPLAIARGIRTGRGGLILRRLRVPLQNWPDPAPAVVADDGVYSFEDGDWLSAIDDAGDVDTSSWDWYQDDLVIPRDNVVEESPQVAELPSSGEWEAPDMDGAHYPDHWSQAPPINDDLPQQSIVEDGGTQPPFPEDDEGYGFHLSWITPDNDLPQQSIVSDSYEQPAWPEDELFGFDFWTTPGNDLPQQSIVEDSSNQLPWPEDGEDYGIVDWQDPGNDLPQQSIVQDGQPVDVEDEPFAFDLSLPEEPAVVVDQIPGEDSSDQLEDTDEDYGFSLDPLSDDDLPQQGITEDGSYQYPEDEPFGFEFPVAIDDIAPDQIPTEDATNQPSDPPDEDFAFFDAPLAEDSPQLSIVEDGNTREADVGDEDFGFNFDITFEVIESNQVFVEDGNTRENDTADEDFGFITDPLGSDAIVGAAPTLYFDIETGRLALLLVDTTTPKIIMLL